MTVLCARYGISRDTGYRLVERYQKEEADGLEPRSRAPHQHGLAMTEEIAAAIVSLRRQRPYCQACIRLRRPRVVSGRSRIDRRSQWILI